MANTKESDQNGEREWLTHLNAADAASLLCITTRQLRNLVELGLPKHGSGKYAYYVWCEVFVWYVAYKEDCAKAKREGFDPSSLSPSELETYKEAPHAQGNR